MVAAVEEVRVELKEAIHRRHSIRKYKPDRPNLDIVADILNLARRAPTAGGLRAYEVTVTEQRLTPYDAPLHLVVCALPERSAQRYGDRGRDLYAVQDATLHAAYIQLLAVDAGLDTCWVGAFREGKVKKALTLPVDRRPVVILAMGYAA